MLFVNGLVQPLQAQSLPDTGRRDTAAVMQLPVVVKPSDSSPAPFALHPGVVQHPYYNFRGKPSDLHMELREPRRDEGLFYLLAVLFLYYALIRLFYDKYYENLIKLFLRATLRQQQLREQLMQTPLPSFLFNLMFFINASLFHAMMLRSYQYATHQSFAALFGYGVGILSLVYLGKYFILKLFGWVVNMTRTVDAYLFMVFLVNKVAGILLLPAILFLSFPYLRHAGTIIPLTLGALALLLGYRFWISFQQVRDEIKLRLFHFFIYICAFEIAPLLVIFKLLLKFVKGSF